MNPIEEWTKDEKILTHIKVCGAKLVSNGLIRQCDREDYEQELWVHLLEIAHKYDRSRAQPITFVSAVIRNFTASYFRAQNAQKRRPPEKVHFASGYILDYRTNRMVEVESKMVLSTQDRRLGVFHCGHVEQIEQQDLIELIKSVLDPEDFDFISEYSRSNVKQTAKWKGCSRHVVRKERDRICRKFKKAGES